MADTATPTQQPQGQESITLANVHQYLDGDGIFLPEDEDGQGPTPHEIDAAIHNASTSLLHDSSDIDATLNDTQYHQHHNDGQGQVHHDGSMIDPSLMADDDRIDSQEPQYNQPTGTVRSADNTTLHRQAKRRMLSEDAVRNPVSHMAPFIRPQRGDDTPHPEQLVFKARDDFEEWINGESSWCHYVQRRVTNPEKRAEERLKARMRAHERTLAAMTPEEAAAVAPLKRRRRNRTSAVVEKITYTCHHAGNYASKHSEHLPLTKLRMNTKQSVKCSCSSRVVLTEVEGGECQVMYYWKHEGHDPFASEELEAGRLPKVVDDWLNEQIRAGVTVDEIRRKLEFSDAAKEEYIRKATEDPSSIEPGGMPALALTVKIKYPDIYNRFRKLRGPLKDSKPPKPYATVKRKARPRGRGDQLPSEAFMAVMGAPGEPIPPFVYKNEPPAGIENSGEGSREQSQTVLDDQVDPELQAEEGPSMLQSEDVDHQFDEHLAQLASDGQLAEALLQLPQGTNEAESAASIHGHGPEITIEIEGEEEEEVGAPAHDEEDNLREAVLRMARAEREDWDTINTIESQP